MSNLKLGIIGAGKMAGALVRGWVSSGLVRANQVSSGEGGRGPFIPPVLSIGRGQARRKRTSQKISLVKYGPFEGILL